MPNPVGVSDRPSRRLTVYLVNQITGNPDLTPEQRANYSWVVCLLNHQLQLHRTKMNVKVAKAKAKKEKERDIFKTTMKQSGVDVFKTTDET